MDLLEAKNAALSYLKISSKEIMSRFRTNMTVESKSDQSPVTVADRKAEEILRKNISKAYPNHGIIGEEFGEKTSPSNGCGRLTRSMEHVRSYVDCHCLPH